MNWGSFLSSADPEIYQAIWSEIRRIRNGLELIASENFPSVAVLEAMGSVMTAKYAEGYPGRRYYGGCEFVDEAEDLARERAKMLFRAEHANVQPHSGTQANMAVYFAVLKPGDTILSMDLSHGGHLSHGSPVNFSGKLYRIVAYGVDPETEQINLDTVAKLAHEHRPKLIMVGFSAYSRLVDFAGFRRVADEVGAFLVADIAHPAGLVAARLYSDPVPYCDAVTSTTHKTLRGPRGGLILCREMWAKAIDKAVFPESQGGPLMHVIAAKAVAFREALAPEFTAYQKQVLANARHLCGALQERGFRIISGGTDNHMFLVDLRTIGLSGREAETMLGEAGITVNRNTIPGEQRPPTQASGIRIGTPAVTTRGMRESEMESIADWIHGVLVRRDPASLERARKGVRDLCHAFPLYPELGGVP
ncbi:MAG: serine hydroxymethyltransferase [bacterium JZ-2024 1]